MGTRRIGFGIVVSTDDTPRAAVARSAPRKRALPKDFFAAHDLAPPSLLLTALADTFYFAKDIEGRFVWGNRLFAERRRLSRADDAIGRRDHDFLLRDIADRVRADDVAVMSGDLTVDNKLEVIADADGMLSWLATTKRPLLDKRGRVVGIEGVSRNVGGAQDIDFDDLARLSSVSLSTFEREFALRFGVTPVQYRRMAAATSPVAGE